MGRGDTLLLRQILHLKPVGQHVMIRSVSDMCASFRARRASLARGSLNRALSMLAICAKSETKQATL